MVAILSQWDANKWQGIPQLSWKVTWYIKISSFPGPLGAAVFFFNKQDFSSISVQIEQFFASAYKAEHH